MRQPAALHPWFTADQLLAWVKEARDKTAYRRRLAIWLTHLGDFPAHRVAELLAVSTPAVWKWVGEYNPLGPEGLQRKGRGGRRWGLLSLEEERAFLAQYLAPAEAGDLLTARQLQTALCKAVGRAVKIMFIACRIATTGASCRRARTTRSTMSLRWRSSKKNFRTPSKP